MNKKKKHGGNLWLCVLESAYASGNGRRVCVFIHPERYIFFWWAIVMINEQ